MFNLINGDYTHSSAKFYTKDTATVLLQGQLVAFDGSNELVVATGVTAVSGKTLHVLIDAPAGVTQVKCIASEYAEFEAKATRPITTADKGLICDMAISSGDQVVDPDATTTDVFTILSSEDYVTSREELVLGVPTIVEYVRVRFTKRAD
jgi:hypothetical protein